MASQFMLAYSGLLRGAGIFAGQPYYCAVTRWPGEHTVDSCCGTQDDCSKPGCVPAVPAPDVPWCIGCPAGRAVVSVLQSVKKNI